MSCRARLRRCPNPLGPSPVGAGVVQSGRAPLFLCPSILLPPSRDGSSSANIRTGPTPPETNLVPSVQRLDTLQRRLLTSLAIGVYALRSSIWPAELWRARQGLMRAREGKSNSRSRSSSMTVRQHRLPSVQVVRQARVHGPYLYSACTLTPFQPQVHELNLKP